MKEKSYNTSTTSVAIYCLCNNFVSTCLLRFYYRSFTHYSKHNLS